MCQDVTQQVTGSSLSGHMLISQASVSRSGQEIFLPQKCVYGTRPVSEYPLGAI